MGKHRTRQLLGRSLTCVVYMNGEKRCGCILKVEINWEGVYVKGNGLELKGICVYWPVKKMVSMERNVYYNKTCSSIYQLEGEELDEFVKTKINEPVISPSSSLNSTSNPSNVQLSASHATGDLPILPSEPHMDAEDSPSEAETHPKQVCKPTQHVRDLLEGRAVASNLPKGQKVAKGVQLLTTKAPEPVVKAPDAEGEPQNQVLEGEGTADWMMTVDFVEEYALAVVISESEALEPHSIEEAKRHPDWPLWEKAIEEELGVLKAAGTWELADAPEGANIVSSKWVFHVKKDAVGNVIHYKACLVAQGFSQVPSIDYFDMFAPVAHLASIRAVLTIAAVEDFEIHQIDIKGAYLNGVLTSDKVLFMRQPPSYAIPGFQGKVCRLRKTLYSLKQSGRWWYQRLVGIMVDELGFARCEVDQAVFFRHCGKSLIIILVHVDDHCTNC